MAPLARVALLGAFFDAAWGVREVVTVPGWPDLKGFPLSFAIKTDCMVYASGLGGTDMRTMKKADGGVGNETQQALRNLAELLHAAGSSMQDVMACSVMLADIKRDFQDMNGAYAKFFPKDPPSRVAVEVGALAGNASVEIKCAAALPGRCGSGREVVEVPGWPSMAGRVPLSMVTKVGGMVYPSGMQGMNMSTLKPVEGGVGAETSQTMANIGEALRAAGSDLDLVLGCEVSLTDISDFEEMTKAYVAAFPKMSGGGLPSRIAVQVGGLAGTGKVEIRCVAATAQLHPSDVPTPSSWKPSAVPFSFATKAGGMVYVSGMPGLDWTMMKPVEGGVGNETHQALSNIKEVLQAAGTSMADVVDCEVSLANIADFKAMNEVYATFWPQGPPARAAVQVGKLFGGKVEIKCVAAAPSEASILLV